MSFSVDQLMQVKCKFQLTSESDSSDSVTYSNCERVRLCASRDFSDHSSLIVLVCSNDSSNNHILTYFIERRFSQSNNNINNNNNNNNNNTNTNHEDRSAAPTRAKLNRPRVIVKQIYYHNYNEDISAICLSDSGDKLILINASATIYVIPIKNILLNLHAKQLRSSQGKSMYFYDASILTGCCSIEEPTSLVHWNRLEPRGSYVIVGSSSGRLSFLDLDLKKELNIIKLDDRIRELQVIRDWFGHSLLITCGGGGGGNLNQYRLLLELVRPQSLDLNHRQTGGGSKSTVEIIPSTNAPPAAADNRKLDLSQQVDFDRDPGPPWLRKPTYLRLFHGSSAMTGASHLATGVFHRFHLIPSATRFAGGGQAGLVSQFNSRANPLPMLFSQPSSGLLCVVDVLAANQNAPSGKHQHQAKKQQSGEPRFLRFYANKQYHYKPQRPMLACKLDLADPDEMITHLVLTDRFLTIATSQDRCLVYSRNCCNLKHSSQQTSSPIQLDPLVKEIQFGMEEKIIHLMKSPASNDRDNIIESFLLVTDKAIYSIEARQSCRDMYINLIDSHLAINLARQSQETITEMNKRQTLMPDCFSGSYNGNKHGYYGYNSGSTGDTLATNSSESNLLINNFLRNRDELYERIHYDSRAFSLILKLELTSLYEAYGDRALQRGHFQLANRFFQMAGFDHSKTLGKYIRLGAFKQTVDYMTNVLNDDNEILEERERLDLSRAAFECLLAKTLVERSKTVLHGHDLPKTQWRKLVNHHKLHRKQLEEQQSPLKSFLRPTTEATGAGCLGPSDVGGNSLLKLYQFCEHSPRCQEAKLSAATIVGDFSNSQTIDEINDDEATLTSNSGEPSKATIKLKHLECEKALLDFIQNLMPQALYDHAMTQLIAFNLIELVDLLVTSDVHVHSLLKILINSREEDRLLFRDSRFETLSSRLRNYSELGDLIKIDLKKPEHLEFMTCPEVTRALVKDISLTCDYFGYQHTKIPFRKHSFAALCQLETYLEFVTMRHRQNLVRKSDIKPDIHSNGSHSGSIPNDVASDESANDGDYFAAFIKRQEEATKINNDYDSAKLVVTEQIKRNFERIFVEFLNSCLNESIISEDSCRLWFNYINFYLNYIGDLEQLEADIMNILGSDLSDCRVAITLYKAIQSDESNTKANSMVIGDTSGAGGGGSKYRIVDQISRSIATSAKPPVVTQGNLESMNKIYNLARLFRNEFLMKLLARTLELVPKAKNFEALVAMC